MPDRLPGEGRWPTVWAVFIKSGQQCRPRKMRVDVFISHSSPDKPAADATCAALESAGIRCWIAPRDVGAGREYAEEIINGIDSCQIMVLIFSSSANTSAQVRREIERAVSKGLTIITLRIEDVMPTKSMEYYLDSIHWLDAVTPPFAEHLVHLIAQVRANLSVDETNAASGPTAAPQLTASKKSGHSLISMSPKRLVAAIGAIVLLLSAGVFGFLVLRQSDDMTKPITKLDGAYIGTYKTSQIQSPRQIFAQFIQNGQSIVGTFETTSLVYGTSTGKMISDIEGRLDHIELQSPRCSGTYEGTLLISGASVSFTTSGKDCLGPSTSVGSLFRSPVAKDVFDAFRKWREAYDLKDQGNLSDAYVAMQQSSSILKAVAQKDPNNQMWRQDQHEMGETIGDVALYFLSKKKFADALSAADLGISLSPDELWIYAAKGCALMLLDRTDEAREIFLKYLDRQNADGDKSWQAVVIDYFNDLRSAGLTAPLMDEIQKRFKAG
jgi:TIR domain